MSTQQSSGVWSLHYGMDGREPIASANDLRAALEHLSKRRPPHAVVLISPTGKTLVVGVGRKRSVLLFQASSDPPYFHSVGDRLRRGAILFDYADQETEFAQAAAVPIEAAFRAAAEFFATDERPESLEWEED
jgi:hypothetical protein